MAEGFQFSDLFASTGINFSEINFNFCTLQTDIYKLPEQHPPERERDRQRALKITKKKKKFWEVVIACFP
jgi:hypothetical protein